MSAISVCEYPPKYAQLHRLALLRRKARQGFAHRVALELERHLVPWIVGRANGGRHRLEVLLPALVRAA